MNRADYDSEQGIAQLVCTLQGLNQLEEERRTAHYERGERLKPWYILGRWYTDECGNFWKITGEIIPKVKYPEIPDVLTTREMRAWFFTNITCSLGSNIPPTRIQCGECGKSWTITNCHDVVRVPETEAIPLQPFVGQTLSKVQDRFATYDDAVYFMHPDILIRNDRFIDRTPDPKYPDLTKNENGWVGKRDGINDDYIIQAGDEGYFNVWRYYHLACQRQHLEHQRRLEFWEIFSQAGYEVGLMQPISNQYCSCEFCAPWFEVTTDVGVFTIGWRKRVININWKELNRNFLLLFKGEDVTKGDDNIHAWGTEKAIEYLYRIRQACSS